MKNRDYKAEYQRRPKWSKVCGWYKSEDKKQGRENNLNALQVKVLIGLPCFWCAKDQAGGLDRRDNNLGHVDTNVVPSCYVCNMILGTLPFEAKMLLQSSMKDLRESGLLENWTPPNPFVK